MTTTSRRRARRSSSRPVEPPDPIKDRTTSILTALVLAVIFAFVMIPFVWLLVHGYRWAIS